MDLVNEMNYLLKQRQLMKLIALRYEDNDHHGKEKGEGILSKLNHLHGSIVESTTAMLASDEADDIKKEAFAFFSCQCEDVVNWIVVASIMKKYFRCSYKRCTFCHSEEVMAVIVKQAVLDFCNLDRVENHVNASMRGLEEDDCVTAEESWQYQYFKSMCLRLEEVCLFAYEGTAAYIKYLMRI
jgi:hypothetical protein